MVYNIIKAWITETNIVKIYFSISDSKETQRFKERLLEF